MLGMDPRLCIHPKADMRQILSTAHRQVIQSAATRSALMGYESFRYQYPIGVLLPAISGRCWEVQNKSARKQSNYGPDWCSVALGRLIWKQTNHSECNRTAYPGRLCLMHLAETRAMSCNVRAAYLWKVRDKRNNWLDKNVATVPMICLVTVYLLEKICSEHMSNIPPDYSDRLHLIPDSKTW